MDLQTLLIYDLVFLVYIGMYNPRITMAIGWLSKSSAQQISDVGCLTNAVRLIAGIGMIMATILMFSHIHWWILGVFIANFICTLIIGTILILFFENKSCIGALLGIFYFIGIGLVPGLLIKIIINLCTSE